MKKNNNLIENSDLISLVLTTEQYDYLLLILTGLVKMEKKVPKNFKTHNSDILLELFNKAKQIEVDFFS